MLFALRQPATLLGLVLGFVASMIAVAGVQGYLAGNKRGLRELFAVRTWLDPYAGVAALLGGAGWAPRPEIRRGFGRDPRRTVWALAVIAIVVPAALAAGGLAGYLAVGGTHAGLLLLGSPSVLYGTQFITHSVTQRILLGFGVECLLTAVLSVVPIPPLATGVAVWTQFPRTAGARRSAYHLLEEQYGIGIVLVLMLPLINSQALLVAILGPVLDDILHAI